ncbi:MAG: hypothetical protein C0469_15525 [Cyanobacteria bacterium DS2.3.42]|nr:hypothetical protein [Cyanobacteria bacterium DS2.3.42]
MIANSTVVIQKQLFMPFFKQHDLLPPSLFFTDRRRSNLNFPTLNDRTDKKIVSKSKKFFFLPR